MARFGLLMLNNGQWNQGLESPRELVKWAYESNIGDVSDVFEFGDKIVVASLCFLS
ncbi:hypothetical protein N9Y26_00235 [bacterium]|nr:hypothetical protein [bacterium]